jgi:hypothetical protein
MPRAEVSPVSVALLSDEGKRVDYLSGPQGNVRALAFWQDCLVAGGALTFPDQLPRNQLAVWMLSATAKPLPLELSVNGSIESLVVKSGQLQVGGHFSRVNRRFPWWNQFGIDRQFRPEPRVNSDLGQGLVEHKALAGHRWPGYNLRTTTGPRGPLATFSFDPPKGRSRQICLGWADAASGRWGYAPVNAIHDNVVACAYDSGLLYVAGSDYDGHGYVAAFDVEELSLYGPEGVRR